MAQEAAVPASFWGRVQKMIDDSIAKYARSGALRNASITGGAGLTVGAGGKLVVQHPAGNTLMLMGAYDGSHTFDMPDGSRQPMALLYRADGSLALGMYDPNTADGLQQFLALYDRAGNIIMSDDTSSGQGLARPYIPATFNRTRYADFAVSTTSTVFETLWDAQMYKQHPQLVVRVRASMDTSGTTGELRVMVNGVQLGTTASQSFAVASNAFGPAAVAGAHESLLKVEIQGRITSASGALKVEPLYAYGIQS
jgi:hypothetical protein